MLSIIIIHYNAIKELRSCLEAIKGSGLNLPFEVVIIDNSCVNLLEALLRYYRKFFDINIITNERNIGYARAVNQGIKLAHGEYLLIINPDISITPKAIESMIAFIKKEKNIGILAPQLLNSDGTIQYSCFRFPKYWTPFIRRSFLKLLPFGRNEIKRYLMLDFDHRTTADVDWVLGAAMMTEKDLIKKIALMDERFFLYFEDVDLCRRFHNEGYRVVYFPEAKFYHRYSRLSATRGGITLLFNKYFWLHLISGLKYFAKWHKLNP